MPNLNGNLVAIGAGGVVLLVLAVGPLFRLLIAATMGGVIGARAIARQPDEIHLEPAPAEPWSTNPHWATDVAALEARGCGTAGIYTVRELPGVVVRLMAQFSDGVAVALYEHPARGPWFDLTSRFADDTSYTITSTPPTGLDPQPGHVVVHAAGTTAEAAYARLLAQRPRTPLRATPVAEVAQEFVRAYAESIAWRKAHGVSRREVVKLAVRRPGTEDRAA